MCVFAPQPAAGALQTWVCVIARSHVHACVVKAEKKTVKCGANVAIKKTELYATLWASCDELRGSMDASQYKNYILTLLFVKYVSGKHAGQPCAEI